MNIYHSTMKEDEISDIRAQLAVIETLDEDDSDELDQLDFEINYLIRLVTEARNRIRDKVNGKSE